MNDELFEAIASDLKMDALLYDLKPTERRCFAIYSGAALWVKAATQDAVGTSLTIKSGSRRHCIRVCSNFIKRCLDDEPGAVKDYFYSDFKDSEKTPELKIINAMIRCRELNETGTDPDNLVLSLPDDRTLQIDGMHQRVCGCLGLDRTYCSASGLSMVYPKEDTPDVLPLIDNNKWVEDYIKRTEAVIPDRTLQLEGDRYFDVSSYGKYIFSRQTPHDDYPFEVVMNQYRNEWTYYIRTHRGFFRIDQMLIETGCHNRFIIYLAIKKGKQTYHLKRDGKIIRLEGAHALPLDADSMIRSVMWPMRNVDDSASFVGPLYLINHIRNIFEYLGMKID